MSQPRRICAGCGHVEYMHGPACVWPGCPCVHFFGVLSEREVEVLKLLAQGKTAKEVALILGTAPRTVENQRNSILKRTGAANVTHAVAAAFKAGILKVADLPDFSFPVFAPEK